MIKPSQTVEISLSMVKVICIAVPFKLISGGDLPEEAVTGLARIPGKDLVVLISDTILAEPLIVL